MSSFFDSGRVADLILALLMVEGTLLLIVHLRTGRGPRPMDLMGMLLPGALLVLALRAALSGGAWPWIALFLSLALPLHLLDLTRRWRR